MNRTELINKLIRKNKYSSYLEIGLDSGSNYLEIQCAEKESVDPFFPEDHNGWDMGMKNGLPPHIARLLTYRMTSDDFFNKCDRKYDIIFIDGLHTEEQVGKDIVNSLRHLNEGGIIVVHDCLPQSEAAQRVPRIQSEWNGDVWKAIVELTKEGLGIEVVDCDYGVGLIKQCFFNKYPEKCDVEWSDFEQDKGKYINIISVNDFELKYLV